MTARADGDKKAVNGKGDGKFRRHALRFMWSEAMPEIFSLSVGAMAMISSSYTNQAVPRLMGQVIDPMSSPSNLKNDNAFATSIVWVGLIGAASSFLRTVSLNYAKENIGCRLRKKAFQSIIRDHDVEWWHVEKIESKTELGDGSTKSSGQNSTSVDPSGFVKPTPASIGLILKEDVDTVASTMTSTVANLLRSITSCTFATINLLSLNPSLVALSLLTAPFVGSVSFLTRKYLKKVISIQEEAALNAASFVEERLNHIMMVKLANREDDEIQTYGQLQEELVDLGRASALANGFSMGAMFFLSTSALCGILKQGGKAVESKVMNHGELVSFGTYSFLLALGSAGIVKAMGDFSKGVNSAVRLCNLLEPSNDETKITPAGRGSESSLTSVEPATIRELIVDNIWFSYRNNSKANILRGISLSLRRGEVVVLTGRNGSGKSTLAMLLAGLYKPNSGNIFVEYCASSEGMTHEVSVDYVNDLSRDHQADLVQVVPQTPALFDASILQNVLYSAPFATEEAAVEALRSANCLEFISKLDGGYNFKVGRNGTRLSGGQRQRLGLARALLFNPVFLILDEPASSLDAEGEGAVSEAIIACKESGRSLLVITHHAKTVRMADRVIVLEDGVIAEEGTYQELESKKGALFSLMPELN